MYSAFYAPYVSREVDIRMCGSYMTKMMFAINILNHNIK